MLFLSGYMNRRLLILFFPVLLWLAPAVHGQADTTEKPYVLATKMPEFSNGGSEGMIGFIQEHLEYPMAEKKADIQGTILMQFIVEKDGSLSDIRAIKSVPGGENLEKEAARVIRMMPKWKPGMQDGQPVRVYKNVPFYFVLAPKKSPASTQAAAVQVNDSDAPDKPEEVYALAETMPSYPGGIPALYSFIQNNLHYPQAEKEAGIQGTVYVRFTVEKDGSITDPRVVKGIPGGKALEDEALNLVKLMPKWTPGLQGGKPVRVYFNLPVKFQLK
jgi:TonB family protein